MGISTALAAQGGPDVLWVRFAPSPAAVVQDINLGENKRAC